MKLRYLARIKLDGVPKELLPLGPATIGKLLDVQGWTVTHQEVRAYGREYWATLELDVTTPAALHPSCVIERNVLRHPMDAAPPRHIATRDNPVLVEGAGGKP